VSPAIVRMPAEIDVTNAAEVYDELVMATASGAAVIVADLTATTFCDSASLQRIVMAYRHAASRGIQVRLAVARDGAVQRVLKLTGIDQWLPVYPSLTEAAAADILP
jgi:anti-anti-sigma factor